MAYNVEFLVLVRWGEYICEIMTYIYRSFPSESPARDSEEILEPNFLPWVKNDLDCMMTVEQYIDDINKRYKLGNATEHTFRKNV